jgi:PAS domain S-box-containing protein
VALRESEGKFHAVYAQSPLAIVLTTLPEGHVADANAAAEALLGHKLADARGRTTTELKIWVDLADRDRYLQLLRSNDALSGFEARVRHRDGTEMSVLYHGRVIQISGQSYVLNSLLDITGRKKSEQQVQHLATFPELNPNPVLEFNGECALVYHNPAALIMAKKVGIANLERLLPPTTQAIIAACLATGQPRLRLETKHGGHTLSWSFFPIAGQRVVHCYVGDITDRQSLEEQLRQAQKMEAVGQLAGGVAHDFNNMLTAIIGHLGLLQGNPQVTPEIAESLDEISAAANRAAKLTSQLLAFSRRQVISASTLDLNEVVTHLTKMLRRILGEEVIMQLDYAPEQLNFHGDAGMMEQVLVNLAVNARDAMPGGGTLRIVTRHETRVPPVMDGQAETGEAMAFVRLSVSDTGTGIPPEIRDKIFEPFFTTKDVGKGTGLGLATVFGIVQQHHGWIEVDSAVGRGTTFNIFLPRLAAAPLAAKLESPAPAARGQNEWVLLVEDEPSVQELGKLALTRNGYRVLAASNGREALELWTKHKAEIALLLTDMVMPDGISGQQLARQLLDEKSTLKVIYSSGYNAEIAGKELKLKDGVNYLAKPYELEELFRTVRAALDGRQSRPPF